MANTYTIQVGANGYMTCLKPGAVDEGSYSIGAVIFEPSEGAPPGSGIFTLKINGGETLFANQSYTNIINGDTGVAFASVAALKAYIKTNFFRNATGGGGITTNALTFNNSGSGDASGSTFNGSAAKTLSYNSIGAQATLASGSNIKTINGTSILGSGNLTISSIYTSDGVLTGNRVITNSGFTLSVSDSLYVNANAIASIMTGATLVGLGTSIMAGTGINIGGIYGASGGIRWFTQLATLLGFTENNLAVSGSTVELQSGYVPSSSFVNARTSVPTYGSLVAGSILVIETGPNDWAIGCTNYNTTNYPTDLASTLTYVKGTKGWPAAQILVLNNSYVDPALYGTAGSGCSGTITSANYLLFQAATLTQATSAGVKYFDVNAWFANHGGNSLLADKLHPNNYGHTVEANGVYTFLKPALVTQAGQVGIAANGLDFADAKIENLNILNNNSQLLGISSAGMLGITQSIPGNTVWNGNAIFNGLIYQQGAAYSFTPSTNHDIILNQPLIYDISPTGTYSTTNLCTAVVGFNFTTNYNSPGDILASFLSPTGTAFSVLQSGKTSIIDSYYVVAGTNNGLKATAAGATTGFYPFTTASGTQMFSDYEIGFLQFSTAPATRGTLVEAARFAASGHLLIGGTTDATYRLDVFNTAARFQNGIAVGIISPALTFSTLTTSASGGTLAAATYYYKIVPVDFFGNEGTASAELFVTTTGSTSSNNLGWTAVTNAASYHIYQGTASNTEGKYITSTTNSAIDIGSGYTTKALPTSNSTYLAQISSTGTFSTTTSTTSTTFSPQIQLTNTQASTGSTDLFSPSIRLRTQFFNTTDKTSDFFITNEGNSATPVAQLLISYSLAGAAPTTLLSIDRFGNFNAKSGGFVITNGNLNLGTAGNKILIPTGTNASIGTSTLVAGTVTVATTAITASSKIFVKYNTPAGTLASGLSTPDASRTAGTSFVINSLTTAGAVNITDTSTVDWWIIN